MKIKLDAEIEVNASSPEKIKEQIVLKACQLVGQFCDADCDFVQKGNRISDHNGTLAFSLQIINETEG
jgi:hypothetical protein